LIVKPFQSKGYSPEPIFEIIDLNNTVEKGLRKGGGPGDQWRAEGKVKNSLRLFLITQVQAQIRCPYEKGETKGKEGQRKIADEQSRAG